MSTHKIKDKKPVENSKSTVCVPSQKNESSTQSNVPVPGHTQKIDPNKRINKI